MPIKRELITNELLDQSDVTKNPYMEITGNFDNSFKSQTSDRTLIDKKYKKESEEMASSGFEYGAVLPRNMTVSLVRSDNANWETIISFLFSLFLSFFMLFLAEYLPVPATGSSFSPLETLAIWILGIFTLIFLITWIILKIKQQQSGVIIPMGILEKYVQNNNED
jgi:hypothetical protein